jgi:hypothetical protein
VFKFVSKLCFYRKTVEGIIQWIIQCFPPATVTNFRMRLLVDQILCILLPGSGQIPHYLVTNPIQIDHEDTSNFYPKNLPIKHHPQTSTLPRLNKNKLGILWGNFSPQNPRFSGGWSWGWG